MQHKPINQTLALKCQLFRMMSSQVRSMVKDETFMIYKSFRAQPDIRQENQHECRIKRIPHLRSQLDVNLGS